MGTKADVHCWRSAGRFYSYGESMGFSPHPSDIHIFRPLSCHFRPRISPNKFVYKEITMYFYGKLRLLQCCEESSSEYITKEFAPRRRSLFFSPAREHWIIRVEFIRGAPLQRRKNLGMNKTSPPLDDNREGSRRNYHTNKRAGENRAFAATSWGERIRASPLALLESSFHMKILSSFCRNL